MPREGAATEERSALSLKVFWRYVVRIGARGGIRWPEICGSISKNIQSVLVIQQQRIRQSNRFHTMNCRDALEHALLHGGHSIAPVTRHPQIRAYQHRVVRFKSEIAVHGMQEPTKRNQRRCDQ